MDEPTREYFNIISERLRKLRNQNEFEKINHAEITKMTPEQLAAWQTKHDTDSPQWKLAEHEWQVRSSHKSRKLSIVAVIISSVSLLIATCGYFFPNQKSVLYNNQIQLREHVLNFTVELENFAKKYATNNMDGREELPILYVPKINEFKQQMNLEGVNSSKIETLFDNGLYSMQPAATASNLVEIAHEMANMARQLPNTK